MSTRRQERFSRVIKEVVSDAIANHLSDPRIEGFVSVTRVDIASDLRSADVYLSIFGLPSGKAGKGDAAVPKGRGKPASTQRGEPTSTQRGEPTSTQRGEQDKTFLAINHAKSRIQTLLAGRLQSKFCPVLNFYMDDKFKKTLETMRLIDEAAGEIKKKES